MIKTKEFNMNFELKINFEGFDDSVASMQIDDLLNCCNVSADELCDTHYESIFKEYELKLVQLLEKELHFSMKIGTTPTRHGKGWFTSFDSDINVLVDKNELINLLNVSVLTSDSELQAKFNKVIEVSEIKYIQLDAIEVSEFTSFNAIINV